MFIIHFGFRKPKIGRGYLYGDKSNPKIVIVRIGFVSIIHMSNEATQLMHKAINGLMVDSDWLYKNHPKIKQKIEEQADEKSQERVDRVRRLFDSTTKELSEVRQELMKRNGEVSTLKKAIEIIRED